MGRRRRSAARGVACIGFALAILAVPTWGTPGFHSSEERTFGTAPALVKYTEYEFKGRMVSVMTMDPKHFDFSVVYANPPKTVGQFHDRSPQTLLTVNGGYWDAEYRPTDLCIAGGRLIKSANTLNRHFGLFLVSQDGSVTLTETAARPLSKSDLAGFRHALKSGPHLIRNGQPLAFGTDSSHARTVIARNARGELLFAVSKTGQMTYAEMAAFLVSTELGITEAFNLDGGRSSGFVLGRGSGRVLRDSWEVANVIQATRKAVR